MLGCRFRMILIVVLSLLAGSLLAQPLVVWVSWEGEDWFHQMGRSFLQKTGIPVQVTYLPSMADSIGMALKGGGTLPDLCLIKNDQLAEIIPTSRAKEADRSLIERFSIDPILTSAFFYQNQQFAVPFYADVQLLYINREVFDRLKIAIPESSWTVDDLEQLMQQLRESGVIPISWGLNSSYIFTGLQAGLGSPVFDQDDHFHVDTQENLQLVQRLKDWAERGWLVDRPQRPQLIQDFLRGQIAMIPQGSFMISTFEDRRFAYHALPFPTPWKSMVDVKGFVQFSDHPEASAFLEHLLLQIEDFARQWIKVPAVASEGFELQNIPEFSKIIEGSIVQPHHPQYAQRYIPAIRTALELVFLGDLSPQKALIKAQEFIDAP